MGISPKVLTEQLHGLDIIRRRIVSKYHLRVEYSLTDMGRGFGVMQMSYNYLFDSARLQDPAVRWTG